MSCGNWSELQKSNSDIASYAMNSFFIRASPDVDMDPGLALVGLENSNVRSEVRDVDAESEELSPWAVSVHAHEYIHFLHNISTFAGVCVFTARLTLLRA